MNLSISTIKEFGKAGMELAKKHAPEILTGVGVVCFVATPILAVKATPAALDALDNERHRRKMDMAIKVGTEQENSDLVMQAVQLKPFDYVKYTWKLYMPAVATGATGIACIIGSTSVSVRRNASLIAACAITETRFSEYKDKVKELFGKKEDDVRSAINEDRIKNDPVEEDKIVDTGKGDTLFYDAFSGRYFKSDISYVERAVNLLNHQLLYDEGVSLNDFYDLILLEPNKFGEDFGWNRNTNGLVELNLDSKLADDGTPCVVLDFIEGPFYTGYCRSTINL